MLIYTLCNRCCPTERYVSTVRIPGDLWYKDRPSPVHSHLLIEQLERCCISPEVLASEHDDQIQGIHGCEIPVYKTVAGEPAAYLERLLSNLEVKTIRSTKCS